MLSRISILGMALNICYAKPCILLEKHPDYDAAKNHENRIAALSLVNNFLKTPENQAQLKMLYCGDCAPTAPAAMRASPHGFVLKIHRSSIE